MTRSVVRICQTKYPKPHSMDRPSTAQQDVRSQRLAILKYTRKHDFRIDDFSRSAGGSTS